MEIEKDGQFRTPAVLENIFLLPPSARSIFFLLKLNQMAASQFPCLQHLFVEEDSEENREMKWCCRVNCETVAFPWKGQYPIRNPGALAEQNMKTHCCTGFNIFLSSR